MSLATLIRDIRKAAALPKVKLIRRQYSRVSRPGAACKLCGLSAALYLHGCYWDGPTGPQAEAIGAYDIESFVFSNVRTRYKLTLPQVNAFLGGWDTPFALWASPEAQAAALLSRELLGLTDV